MNPPDVVLEELLAQDTWVRALARRLVADEHAAEDVVQDAWVSALRSPPGRRSTARTWLARVVRNRVFSLRRSAGHRESREREAARSESLPSVDRLMERETVRLQVAKAVYALEEPYRSAIFYRYFEGLPPREIAARLDVPAATVETRLKRGIGMLRARLDREFGGDRRTWCTALLPLIGPPAGLSGTSIGGGSGVAVLSGALIMNMKLKVGIAVGLLLAVVAGIAFWPDDTIGEPPRLEPEATVKPVNEPPPIDRHAEPRETRDAPPPVETSPVAAHAESVPRESPAEDRITIQGRCVDAVTREPLADCTVSVKARLTLDSALTQTRYTAEVEDLLLEQGEIRWKDPAAFTTGRDGVFVVRFRSPPPVPVELAIERKDRTPVEAFWKRGQLRPGAVEDLGDVALEGGARVSGRVVDTEGKLQPSVPVELSRPFGSFALPASVRSQGFFSVTTGSNGLFRVPWPVPPGKWTIRARGRYLAGDARITIPPGASRHPFEVVVKKLPAITGIIVDGTGAPVPGAWVDFHPTGTGSRYFANRSRADGTFRLERRPEDPEGPVTLTAAKEGYEAVWRQGSHAWNSTGVRIVLRRGVPVRLRVTDAATGQPVERFGVRFYSTKPDQARIHQPHRRLRHAGRHPDGVLLLDGVRRGPNVLMVEPLGTTYVPSRWLALDVSAGETPEQHVRLVRPVTRTLRVFWRDANETPVAGTQVELVRSPVGAAEISMKTPVGRSGRYGVYPHDRLALLLKRGTTDARGELVLTGPPGERLALKLKGPGLLNEVVNGVVLGPEEAPLKVPVDTGATLTGRIRPPAVTDALTPAAGSRGPAHHEHRPWIRLVRVGGRAPSLTAIGAGTADRTEIDADGRFEIRSIPAGNWLVYLSYSVETPYGIQMQSAVRLCRVNALKDGETRPLDLDLSHLMPGRLEGTIFLNGEPLAGKTVSFRGTRMGAAGRRESVPGRQIRTDPDGKYTVSLVPGEYVVRADVREAAGFLRDTSIACEETVMILPGGYVQKDFRFRSAVLDLRVVGSDGRTPVNGVTLRWSLRGRKDQFTTLATDEDGRLKLMHMPVGTLVFQAWPKRLGTPEAFRAFLKENPKNWRKALIDLGTVEITTAGQALTRELVMPPESGY